MAHKKSDDEKIFLEKIHYHIQKNTLSGIKIRECFPKNEKMYISTMKSGGKRKDHYDFKLTFPDGTLKNVEFKGSQKFKPIDDNKPPWHYGVQFYNGAGNNFSIGQKYARHVYDTGIDTIIEGLQITTPKPNYEEWAKDAFREAKPKTPFVCEIRNKGYCGSYLSNLRLNINRNFTSNTYDMMVLMDEVQTIANDVFEQKDYWLQIHGNIDDPETFHVKWTPKMSMPQIITVEETKSKSNCDIMFRFICDDGFVFYAQMRWGYGQLITNIRIDLKTFNKYRIV